MRVSNEMWQDGERVKLNASEIAIGDKDKAELLPAKLSSMLNHLENIEVVKSDVASGDVIDMEIPDNHIYLLLVGRDNGVYLISRHSSDTTLTPIIDFPTLDVELVGNRLVVGFRTRMRPYVLLRLR